MKWKFELEGEDCDWASKNKRLENGEKKCRWGKRGRNSEIYQREEREIVGRERSATCQSKKVKLHKGKWLDYGVGNVKKLQRIVNVLFEILFLEPVDLGLIDRGW